MVLMYGMPPSEFRKDKGKLNLPKTIPNEKPYEPIPHDKVVSMLLGHIEAMCDSPDVPTKFKIECIKKMISDYRKGDWEDWLIPPKSKDK